MGDEYEYVKCLLRGNNSVVKTTLCVAHNPKQFPQGWVSARYHGPRSIIQFDAGGRVILRYDEVVDLPGPEDVYHWCDVYIVSFSLVDPRSYENILKEYYAHFTTWRFDVPILVVGTKCDRVNPWPTREAMVNHVDTLSRLRGEWEAPLTRKDGLRLAETINAVGYFECSSLTGVGVEQVFREACKAGLDAKKYAR